MTSRLTRCLALTGLVALSMAQAVRAQGIIIDIRPTSPVSGAFEIREVRVDARIREQVAEVQVSQTFHNPGSFQVESEYLFPLPEEGAIQNFVLLVDGKEMPGRILPKDEARRTYENIVRTKRDPALLEYMGRGLFKTSVFPIPPGADRKVTMRYTQLCKRDRDVVEFVYPFSTQKFTCKPIQKLSLAVELDSKDPIKSVYCTAYDLTVDRKGDQNARISFEQRDTVPTSDFRLLYTLARGELGASVLSYRPSNSEDGYFLLLASPEVKPTDARPRPKTVVFVLDRSGSMAGKKIEQAKKALQFVLNNLRDDDLFNIIVYDDRIEPFKPELQRYSSRSREEAERFVENIREGGSTNIDAALKSAMGMLHDESRPSYVLFLTDGLPTAGETGEMTIADDCRRANTQHARLFAFGVGYDVNARLLDRLSGGNSGTSEYVKPNEDIETHVGRFYSKMTSPVLSGISVELSGTDLNRTYPRDIPDLFEGGQLVLVGRYRQSGRTTVRVSGKIGDERRTFEFPAELASADSWSRYDFVERIWAVRRVGFLIDQIDMHGRSSELIEELVSLSRKFGILTPYTSFLADETVPLHATRENLDRAERGLADLERVTGQSGVAQRDAKQFYLAEQKAQAPAANLPAGAGAQKDFAASASEPAGRYSQPGFGAGGAPSRAAGGANGFGGGGFSQSQAKSGAGSKPAPDQRALELSLKTTATNQTLNSGARLKKGSVNAYDKLGLAYQDAEGRRNVTGAVRQIGKKTFYFKASRWVDSEVKPEEETKATEVKQFSDAFFELARTQKAELNQYLTFDEPVTMKLDGKVYRFEVAERKSE